MIIGFKNRYSHLSQEERTAKLRELKAKQRREHQLKVQARLLSRIPLAESNPQTRNFVKQNFDKHI